jgi:catechol 2,3-dioxygenase-like lactoylglutathione lyase family enzyme
LLKPHADSISPRHFALVVNDPVAAREQLRRQGVALEETTPIPGADRFFVRDPDGNRIELIHWSRPYNPSVDGRSLV